MKPVVFDIPQLSVEVTFTARHVTVRDKLTDIELDSKDIDIPFDNVIQEDYNIFTIENSGTGKDIKVTIMFVDQHSILDTGAMYILDLYLEDDSHGYFFGLYQIGEFRIGENDTVESVRDFDIQFVNSGWPVSDKKLFYLSIGEGEVIGSRNYFLVEMDWNAAPPRINWKKPLQSAAVSMFLHQNLLFLGFTDGSMDIWDIERREIIMTRQVFDRRINRLEGSDRVIISSSESGEIAVLSFDGKILWKKQFSESGINGITLDKTGIHAIDRKGNYYTIKAESGDTLSVSKWKPVPASNLAITRDWLVCNGQNEYGMHALYLKDQSIDFQYIMEDPLIRRIRSHERGFVTGDDEGKIRMWRLGKIKKENKPPSERKQS
ncbi:MAG: hypothetical protein ACTSRU_12615 [Candidatus Hodarchaeales archaeon]